MNQIFTGMAEAVIHQNMMSLIRKALSLEKPKLETRNHGEADPNLLSLKPTQLKADDNLRKESPQSLITAMPSRANEPSASLRHPREPVPSLNATAPFTCVRVL